MRMATILAATVAAIALAGPVSAQQTQGSMQQGTQSSAGASEYDTQTIRQVQQALQREGQDVGEVDGIWGPQTQNALRQYQQAQGMEASGELDENTLSALGVEASGGTGMTGSTGTTGSGGTDMTGSGGTPGVMGSGAGGVPPSSSTEEDDQSEVGNTTGSGSGTMESGSTTGGTSGQDQQ